VSEISRHLFAPRGLDRSTASGPVGIAAAGRDAMWKGYLGYLFLFNVFVAVFIFANGESYIGFHN